MTLNISEKSDGIYLNCRVTPRTSKSGIKGKKNGSLLVGLHSAPTDGNANRELVEIIADALKIPKSRIEIVKGLKSREKTIYVQGITSETLKTLIK